ncbi:MAG: hypothetical protein ACOYT4_01535 [Nanoarchaeota archaeon]
MEILFEKNLEYEANIAKKTLEKIFKIECKIQKGNFKGLLKFNKKLNGYEVQINKKFKNNLLLTSKNIFPLAPLQEKMIGFLELLQLINNLLFQLQD